MPALTLHRTTRDDSHALLWPSRGRSDRCRGWSHRLPRADVGKGVAAYSQLLPQRGRLPPVVLCERLEPVPRSIGIAAAAGGADVAAGRRDARPRPAVLRRGERHHLVGQRHVAGEPAQCGN